MKVRIYVVLSALSMLSVGAMGQCARPEMNPIWDTDKQQFRCVATAGSEVSSHDETVSPKGDKAFCNNARENLLKACPASNEGKTCKSKAKSIFNAFYKDSAAHSESQTGSASTTNQAAKLIQQFACRPSVNNNKCVSRASSLRRPPDNRPLPTPVCRTL